MEVPTGLGFTMLADGDVVADVDVATTYYRAPGCGGAAAGILEPTSLTVDGRRIAAKPGQTLGGALHDAGEHVLSRSFKYHRPRGLFCMTGRCPNCLCTVNGTPNTTTRLPRPAESKPISLSVLSVALGFMAAEASHYEGLPTPRV